MTTDIAILIVIIISIIICLYKEIFQPATTFLIAVTILGILDILSAEEILSGFSNEQIAVIMLLLIVSNIVQKTNTISILFEKIFHNTNSYRLFLAKLMLMTSSFSAFFNNTPVVSMLIPYVSNWGKRHGIKPSKLLIPLSFSTILGGAATLVGTSTNLIINGLAMDLGLKPFNIFDFAYVGVPLILVGYIYMLLWGHKLLPEKKDALEDFQEKTREYIVETIISKGSTLIGKSIEEANLRHLRGLFLVEIIRDKKTIAPVSPSHVLMEKDKLIFAGATTTILDIIKPSTGLSLPQFDSMLSQEKLDIIEAVVPYNSFLIGKKIKETNFRANYDAAILAVHRNNVKLTGKIGNIELKSGDLLLLISGKDFWKTVNNSQDFYIVDKLKEIHNINFTKNSLVILGTFLAIFLSAIKVISLFKALLLLIVLSVVTKIVSVSEIKRSFNLNLLAIAAFAFAIGKAMINTGAAELIANSIISACAPLGTLGIFLGIYLITNIMTEFINNNAAASIVFPIAYTTAISLNMDPTPFILLISYAASGSFITPIGYFTNLMVYGPGGYEFKDFARVGFPLSILYMLTTIVLLGLMYQVF